MATVRRIPTRVIAPLVIEALAKIDSESPSLTLATAANIKERKLWGILNEEYKTIEFDVADRLICAISDAPALLWRSPELRFFYYNVDLTHKEHVQGGIARCAHPGCSQRFVPTKQGHGQKYCSTRCRHAHWRERAGRQNRRSEQMDFMCRNKHVRTPENTKIRPNGTRLCLECTRATDRARRERRREQVAA